MFEDFGPALLRAQFNDVVRLMFEDVAGFELMSEQTAADHVRSLWIVYRRLARLLHDSAVEAARRP